jgi:uncharacterized protein YbdZ (MbtH family)
MSYLSSSLRWRVMQMMETGEQVNVFEGNEEQCQDWLDENAEQYVESHFTMEVI